jgi:hypothetical protein
MLAHGTDFLDDLDPTRARADDCNAFVLELDLVVGPMCSVIHFAFELRRTLDVRDIPVSRLVYTLARLPLVNLLFGREAHVGEHPFAQRHAVIGTFYLPSLAIFKPKRRRHVFEILDVLSKIPFLLHVSEVLLELAEAREPLRKCEAFPNLLVEELVSWHIAVYTSTGV